MVDSHTIRIRECSLRYLVSHDVPFQYEIFTKINHKFVLIRED